MSVLPITIAVSKDFRRFPRTRQTSYPICLTRWEIDEWTKSTRGNEPLTVGGELNKLAANVALGRNAAGVHWRSDAVEGLLLGEALALSVLADLALTYHESFAGFPLTRFDGRTVMVSG